MLLLGYITSLNNTEEGKADKRRKNKPLQYIQINSQFKSNWYIKENYFNVCMHCMYACMSIYNYLNNKLT